VVGYHAAASHELVPIEHCLLAEPHVDAAIGAVGELARGLRAPLRRVELLARDAHTTAVVASGEIEGGWDTGDEATCGTWIAAHPQIAGLVLSGRGWRRSWGEVWVEVEAEPDLALRVHAPAFTQVNPRANLALVEAVIGLAAPVAGMRVLDLFAGAGNLSLPLHRRGAEIVAVEQDRQAVADALANAARQGAAGFRVIRGRADRAVAQLAGDRAGFELALLDPPRSGAAACLPSLLEIAPARIIYVSCDPATLARDLRALGDRYRVDVVQPIDMFPHTYHVEIVVHATLSCESGTPGVSSARRHGSAEPRRRRRTRGRKS
jgi:23S rRNA (uracil1939-C5)-methyltransferase